ncbi:MAG: M3 family oligoendopeptidase [bacterium]
MKKPAYKTEWDFANLFYKKSIKDPLIEIDVAAAENMCVGFEKKYTNNQEYLHDVATLKTALDDYEILLAGVMSSKPLFYLQMLLAVDSQNNAAQAKMNLLSSRLTAAFNKIIFFELRLGKVSESQQNKFLQATELKKYKYLLDRLFLTAKYQLSEPEEKILNLKYPSSRGMWNDYSEKLLNAQTLVWKGKNLPLPEATNMIRSLPKKERHALHTLLCQKLQEISFFAEAEMTAILTDKKTTDELKGFKKPYESWIIGNQNSIASIENLVTTITKNFNISHKFHALQAKLLKEKTLSYPDRAVGISKKVTPFAFEEGVSLFTSALKKTDPMFAEIFQKLLKNGQVDVYPRKGKGGGAFCSSSINQPTMIMLNNTPNVDSFFTLAHEMGHAFHGELSKTQSPMYQDYTISVAEVASTFFENIAVEAISAKLTDKERVELEFQRLQDDIGTIFRQVACFNYEIEIHNEVRSKGSITKERLADLHNQHMSKYLGPLYKMKDVDGYMFVQWTHIRHFFYVYTYAYGQIISKALYARYKKDPTFIHSIIKFLSAGGSMSPDDIFKSIGIDTTQPEFFLDGLREVESSIKRIEIMAKKLGMIK